MTRRETSDLNRRDTTTTLRARLLGMLGSILLRLEAATWSVHSEGVEAFDEALAAGHPLLAVFWHGKYTALFPLMRNRGILIFASLSRRGDVIAELCRRFGYRCAQIPDHGAERSLDLMRSALADESAGAVVVDGPLGPHRGVKRGAVVLASEQGRVIFPISVAARRKKVFAHRWDRREVPRPFSRVALVIGEPLDVPAALSKADEKPWQELVRQALDAVDARAERWVAAGGSQDGG